LLLYLPAHLSAPLAWMHVLNYALSVTMAWLVLRERRLPIATRVLSIFGVFVFFHMGVPARSYMLAAVLLVGAARCLLADRPRHWLAMVLLALAINTHFLAIPAAAGIFVWLYWLDPVPGRRVAIERLRERQFWISAAILGAALAVCYLTLRPAPDGATPDYDIVGASWLDYLMIGTGRLWSYFVPFIPEMLRGSLREKFIPELHPSTVAAALSVGLWLLVVASLGTRRGRWFFASTSLLWMAAMLATVHTPSPHHVSTLFVILLVALMLNSQPVLVLLLAMQMVMSLECSVLECDQPFSSAEATADWLEHSGLAQRPLVVEPDYAASVLLARTGARSAYFPACHCQGQFVVFRKGRDETRRVTVEEIEVIERSSGEVPVILSHWTLSDDNLQRMGLRLVYTSPHGVFWPYEDLYAYSDASCANTEATVTKP
jgi:hypothetical protein